MSKWKLQYYEERAYSPVSYWVHIGKDEVSTPYFQCAQYDPPFPEKDSIKGFPFLIVTVSGFELRFASILELEHCIEILSQKNLPPTLELSEKRGTSYGPNNHWLSRLPGKLKAWSKREKIVDALIKSKKEIEQHKNKF